MYKKIKRRKGYKQQELIAKIIVDDDMRIILDYYSWRFCGKPVKYITTTIDRKKTVKLHHMIIGVPPKGMITDHKNGNTFDNRRNNLHFVSYSYNNANKKKRKDSKQEYKGVHKLPSGKYRAWSCGKHLGIYDTAKEAFIVYRKYSELKFGKLYAY